MLQLRTLLIGIIIIVSVNAMAFSPDDVKDLKAGGNNICAIVKNKVNCWGTNAYGQTDVPKNLRNPRQLAISYRTLCALTDDGVKCWGGAGELGSAMPILDRPVEIVANGWSRCARASDGIHCWGSILYDLEIVPANLKNSQQFAVGGNHFICMLNNDKIFCRGDRDYGKLRPPPVVGKPIQLALGDNFGCVLTDRGVTCWGAPIGPQPSLRNPRQIAAGYNHVCAITDDGVICWGNNLEGQTDVPLGLKNPRQIVAGSKFTCALTDSGIECWGRKVFP